MDLVLIVATVIVAGLIFSLLVRVVRAALGTLITLGLVLLVLQFLFGISFNDIWQEMAQLWRNLEQAIA
ncbi:hypothetical protein [Leptolyngbya sp. 7M]|uniref:hypothetical protein n=1 Tax=Leptolyngbya sp. 7M TaxID=2812896 RepID=UPI001B8AB3E6|nr:hypothetical protein [Leptolyngbya sp. 7M]QYO63501.1 hypothetical protein JVX88_26955 [Leptolyngbya sp. 7M]